jgi:hypothetical protein
MRGGTVPSAISRGRRNSNCSTAEVTMEVRLVSSLTPEDEDRLAPVVLTIVGTMLDQFPLAYEIRIVTPTGKAFLRTSTPSIDVISSEE